MWHSVASLGRPIASKFQVVRPGSGCGLWAEGLGGGLWELIGKVHLCQDDLSLLAHKMTI